MHGNLRQTDFYPVGEGIESETIERRVLSESNDTAEEFVEFVGAGSGPYFSEIALNLDFVE